MDLKYTVIDEKYNNIRSVLINEFKISSRLFLKLRKGQKIYINGCNSFVNESITLGDIIEVDLLFDETSQNIIPTKMDLQILYEDKYLLVLNKPPYTPVHPSMRHFEDTLSNGVQYYYIQNNLHRKIRIVNRLDKDTSGIVIFAKSEYIQELLTSQMVNGLFKKEYLGILEGIVSEKSGIINAPITRKKESIIERCISNDGQTAITHFDVLKEFSNMSLVHFVLETRSYSSNTCTFKIYRSSNSWRYIIWKCLSSYFKTSTSCI